MASRRGRSNASASAALSKISNQNMASRIEKLEDSLQSGLKELKDQVLNEAPRTPSEIGTIFDKIAAFEKKALDSISTLKTEVTQIQDAIWDHKQHYNLNTIIVSGLAENGKENLYEEIPKFVKNYLQINISSQDIDYCYRLGKKNDSSKSRPVAVRFVNRWQRDEVFKVKKRLKGSGIVISEYLVSKILMLYKQVREMVGVKNCWSWMAKIYVNVNNTKMIIRNAHDLNQLKQ